MLLSFLSKTDVFKIWGAEIPFEDNITVLYKLKPLNRRDLPAHVCFLGVLDPVFLF